MKSHSEEPARVSFNPYVYSARRLIVTLLQFVPVLANALSFSVVEKVCPLLH